MLDLSYVNEHDLYFIYGLLIVLRFYLFWRLGHMTLVDGSQTLHPLHQALLVVGPESCGKTTLLRALLRLVPSEAWKEKMEQETT